MYTTINDLNYRETSLLCRATINVKLPHRRPRTKRVSQTHEDARYRIVTAEEVNGTTVRASSLLEWPFNRRSLPRNKSRDYPLRGRAWQRQMWRQIIPKCIGGACYARCSHGRLPLCRLHRHYHEVPREREYREEVLRVFVQRRARVPWKQLI